MITPVSDELVQLVEPGHQYVVGEGLTERSVPSLSALMKNAGLITDYAGVDPDLLAFRARVGTYVHEYIAWAMACHGEDFVPTDDDRFVREHAGVHVDAFQRWYIGHDVVPAFSEVPSYNPALDYACTADFVGTIDGELWVVDWKSTSRISKTVAIQTMGQARCFDINGALMPFRRGALHLPKKGLAKMHEHKDHVVDFQTLKAMSRVWHAKKLYGLDK